MIKVSLYFALISIIYLNPIIPISVKGILGVIFIIISSTETNLKGSLLTAIILIIFQMVNLLHNNVDFKSVIMYAIIGSLMYIFTAIYLDRSADKLKYKNKELQNEIDLRKNIEKELKENLFTLESLMSTLPTPVCFKDLDFKFTGCNSAYEEYFGVSKQDIIGKSSFELFEAEFAEPCYQMELDLFDNKINQAREVNYTSKDGCEKSFIFTKAMLRNDEGNPTGIVGVFLDTTDQKERERLKQSVEEEKLIIDEMQKYDKLKTEFFSNISHELRTPLNVIFCAVQLMEMNLDNENSANRHFVKKNVISIKQNSLRLLRLVNNLIDITRIDAQSFEVSLRNRDIVYVVAEIVLSVTDYVTNKGLKLIFHSDIEEKIVAFDEEKIERIMLNLLSNAIKFSPLGESIYVNIFEKGSNICIEVRDMGIGIPSDRKQDIFQRFYQISPVNTRLQEGSGIGLNLVKSLVEMHQGKITVDSEYGNGTTFTIELPNVLLPEDAFLNEESKKRQTRIENVQLEFSDIYLINK